MPGRTRRSAGSERSSTRPGRTSPRDPGSPPPAAAGLRGRARLVRRGAARRACCRERDRADERLLLAQGRDPRASLPRAGPGRPLRLSTGMARVVVLDRETGEAFTVDIGDENPVAVYVPGHHRARLRGAHGSPLLLPRHPRVRPGGSGRARHLLGRPARQAPVEHGQPDPVGAGRDPPNRAPAASSAPRSGRPSPTRRRRTRAELDVTEPIALDYGPSSCSTRPPGRTSTAPRRDEEGALARERGGDAERRRARRARRLLLVRLRLRRGEARALRRVGRAGAARRLRAREASGRAGGAEGLDRQELLALRLDRAQLRADDARARRGAGRGAGRRRPAWAARRTSATSLPRRGARARCPGGVWHVAAEGEATWAEFAEAIFDEAGIDCRVVRISTAELGRPAPRPPIRCFGASARGARASALARGPAGVPRPHVTIPAGLEWWRGEPGGRHGSPLHGTRTRR